MKKLVPLTTAILAATLAGCAATPRAYYSEESRALNLARADGIYDMDLRDSEDGTRSYSKGMLVPLLDLASLATSFDAPLRHLSGTQTFLFNAADIMVTPDKPSARPSLMGWMPASMAGSEMQAHEQYVALVDQAIEKVSSDMGLTAAKLGDVKAPEIDGHPLILWSIESDEYGCGVGQCVVVYNIQHPNQWKTPGYVIGGEAAGSYNIAANHPEEYSRLVFLQSGHDPAFPTDEFYGAVSAAMPPWMVMYFPPNTVIRDGEPVPYPVLYEQGIQLMFKEPQS